MNDPRHVLRVGPLVQATIRLDPMRVEDADALFAAAQSAETFRWFSVPPVPWSVDGMRAFCAHLLADPTMMPFTVRDVTTGEVVGSSSYGDIRPAHRGLEIGWTFITPSRRGTATNLEMKLAMLGCAFATPLFTTPVPGQTAAGPAVRVMLKTHHQNLRSQRAIEKLGALREGVLRNHIVMPDGSLRHTVIYSITPEQWPDLEFRLRERLHAGRSSR